MRIPARSPMVPRPRTWAIAVLAAVLAAMLATGARADAPPGPDPAGATLLVETQARSKETGPGPAPGCTPVRRIEVRGVVAIDAQSLARTLRPLAADCIGNDDVKALLAAINGAYAEAGFVATQGYLPEQDLRASRTLVVNVIAGRIEALVYREAQADEALPPAERWGRAWARVREASGPWSLVTGLSGLFDRIDDPLDTVQILPRSFTTDLRVWSNFVTGAGEVVQIDAIQQGIDGVNRVASSRAAVKLEAGAAPATSRVVIENSPEDSFRVSAGYELNGADINGSGTTVPSRFKLDAAKDNLVGVNDAWRLSYAGGLNSNEARGAVSVPFRRYTLSFDGGYSESLSEVAPGVEVFSRDGTLSGSLGTLLLRTRDRQVNLDTTLFWRSGERFLNGVSLTPRTVTHARLGVSETRSFDALQVTYGAGIDHGLSWLGARGDPAWIAPGTPRGEFWKLDGQASLAQPLPDAGLVRLDMNAQWSAHPLLSDDQLVLGSVSTVRGFTNSAVRADRGVVLRAEFAPSLPLDRLTEALRDQVFLSEALAGLQPYAFADYGVGRDIANRDTLERAGLGAGLRYRHGRITLDASLGEPVYRTGGVKPRRWQAPEAYLTLLVKLL